ncbi:PREDICTED: protein IQ-DOMAIN 14 [Ipomoea nil]|uniref:protein IQ-DOMAIN 14 n=1 Tax=Ipomoea nil TaxID=35883 RepID=UPI00090154D7|nr:PREDICTED: protein IQ-DOMAIN 14 [Ipomoea nil]XP_019175268.1 PREDICTED: protein IQ-DOMAIN 14 [Ipomoea nil]
MGKKGSWFSAIKRVFTPNTSKDKQIHASEKKNSKEKKGRVLKHGESKSFIPLFREPSSIEKILGEADEQRLLIPLSSEQPRFSSGRPASPRIISPRATSPRDYPRGPVSPPRVTSPRAASLRVTTPRAASPRATSPRAASPRAASSKSNQHRKEVNYVHRPEPTLQVLHVSATTIQAAFRGYMARRSFRALRGLVRLQGVVRGNNVKKQTVNAMKQMQLLVRVQTQIQSRRIQMLENQALQSQALKNDKDGESTLSKWTQLTEAGNHENWDDSTLTKDEIEERWRRKVEAVIKRERAMAYAYSHQLWKGNPKSALDIRSSGYPWWWNWLERQLPPPAAAAAAANPSENQSAVKNVHLTPPRPVSDRKPPSPRLPATNFKPQNSGYDNHEAGTPTSSKSAVPVRGKQFSTPGRTTPPSSSLAKLMQPRGSGIRSPFDFPLKDDDSLTSCPPFSVPSYMAPTVSAKAKARASSNPRERSTSSAAGTPTNDSKRRFSFPLTPNIASFKWNRGSSKDPTTPQRETEKQGGDGVSVDSTVSMPAIVGRKPFNRFV